MAALRSGLGPVTIVALAALGLTRAAATEAPAFQATDYHDGHARPRALAFNADDGLLYAALSTADAVAIVDPHAVPPRVVGTLPVCRFPGAVVAMPGGGAVVACRFEPGLRHGASSAPPMDAGGSRRSRPVP